MFCEDVTIPITEQKPFSDAQFVQFDPFQEKKNNLNCFTFLQKTFTFNGHTIGLSLLTKVNNLLN